MVEALTNSSILALAENVGNMAPQWALELDWSERITELTIGLAPPQVQSSITGQARLGLPG